MPGFGKELSDRRIAVLRSYLTQRWGNPKARVTMEQVRTLRAGGPGSPLLMLARLGMVVVLVIAVVGAWRLKRRRRRA